MWAGRGAPYPWGFVYGGHLAAQSIHAAALSADLSLAPSSFHCTFVRPARVDSPLTHRVHRLSDSPRRATRALTTEQDGAVVMDAMATLDAPAAGPDALEDRDLVPLAALEAARHERFIDDPADVGFFSRRRLDLGTDHVAALIVLDDAPASLTESACVLAYVADDLPSDAARQAFSDETYLEGPTTPLWSLTSTYALHLGAHLPGRRLVLDTVVRGVLGSRATVDGTLVDLDSGRVVALLSQQVLLRRRRNSPARS